MTQYVTITRECQYKGETGKIVMIYYSFSGDADLLYIEMPDGTTVRVLSTDVEGYAQ